MNKNMNEGEEVIDSTNSGKFIVDKKKFKYTVLVVGTIVVGLVVSVFTNTVNNHKKEVSKLVAEISIEKEKIKSIEKEKELIVKEKQEVVKEIKVIENEKKKKEVEIDMINVEKKELEEEVKKEKAKVKTLTQGDTARTSRDISNNKSVNVASANRSNSSRNVTTTGKVIHGEATAYGATVLNGGAGGGKTATGVTPIEGRTIAVDRKMIPLGSKVKVTCDGYPAINGVYIAEDVGGAIKGNRIDVYFNDLSRDKYEAQKIIRNFGRRKVKLEIVK